MVARFCTLSLVIFSGIHSLIWGFNGTVPSTEASTRSSGKSSSDGILSIGCGTGLAYTKKGSQREKTNTINILFDKFMAKRLNRTNILQVSRALGEFKAVRHELRFTIARQVSCDVSNN